MSPIPCGGDQPFRVVLVTALIGGGFALLAELPFLQFAFLALAATSVLLAAAAAGAVFGAALVLGVMIGYCFHTGNTKIKSLGKDICVAGVVEETSVPDSSPLLGPFRFTDRVIDMAVRTPYLNFISDFAQNVKCNRMGTPLLRLEIESRAHNAACTGGVVGTAVGSVAGVVLGALAGAAFAGAVCGPFAIFCFVVALIVALVVAAIITAIGAWGGGVIGGAIGEAQDEGDPLLETAATVRPGTCLTAQGPWINDTDHGWNEIHPVATLRLNGELSRVGRTAGNGIGALRFPPPFTQEEADSCMDDCPVTPLPFG